MSTSLVIPLDVGQEVNAMPIATASTTDVSLHFDYVVGLQRRLISHESRARHANKPLFGTHHSQLLRQLWFNLMAQHSVDGQGTISNVRTALYCTRKHPLLFRSLQNEYILTRSTIE